MLLFTKRTMFRPFSQYVAFLYYCECVEQSPIVFLCIGFFQSESIGPLVMQSRRNPHSYIFVL